MDITLWKGNFLSIKCIYVTGISRNMYFAKRNAVLQAFQCPRTRKFHELEEKLFKYFEETRNSGNAVSHKMLQLRACEIT
jgi:hypothetical protein